MPTPKKGPSLGANPSHQRLMLRNLARSLFEQESVRTTEAKAKLLRPYAERLITKAKRGGVHSRRQVLSAIQNRDVVHKLFDDIGPRFSTRSGGYTRILKLGPRNGDGAQMALIELVEEGAGPSASAARGDQRGRRRLRRPGRRRAPQTEDTEETQPEVEAAEAEMDEAEMDEAAPPDDDVEEAEEEPS